MAQFEGKLNLNVETSEIEVNGKFLLTDDELSKVAGGGLRFPEPASIDDITIGDSVWASDSKGVHRWGTVENIGGGGAYIRFGSGSIFFDGAMTQVESEVIWTSSFFLSAF